MLARVLLACCNSSSLLLSTSGTRGHAEQTARPSSATIVVNNFNYERYLKAAIDSALAQTHPSQVVVVDDASTDRSRSVIKSYGDRVLAILKSANEGQASAMNVGFAAATGDVVIFLDSDDYLAPTVVETVLSQWRSRTVMAHYALTIVDAADRYLGVYPDPPSSLTNGDVRASLLSTGGFVTTVTSGLAFARRALERAMPIPLAPFRTSADGYLTRAVAFYGDVQRIEGPLGFYRKHGRNVANVTSAPGGLAEGFRRKIWHARNEFDATRALAAENGLSVSEALGETNADYLGYRLFSLLLAPDKHPVSDDRRWTLLRRYIGARWASEYSLQRKLLAIGLAAAAGVSSRPLSEVFVRWLHDPDSRPTWFPSNRSVG